MAGKNKKKKAGAPRSGGGDVRGKLRSKFVELNMARPFPRTENRSAYTSDMISDLSQICNEVDNEELRSELAAATDESQWLDMLLNSCPVSVAVLSAEFSRLKATRPFPTSWVDRHFYTFDMMRSLEKTYRKLDATHEMYDAELCRKLFMEFPRATDETQWWGILRTRVLGVEANKPEDQLRMLRDVRY